MFLVFPLEIMALPPLQVIKLTPPPAPHPNPTHSSSVRVADYFDDKEKRIVFRNEILMSTICPPFDGSCFVLLLLLKCTCDCIGILRKNLHEVVSLLEE